MQQLERNLLPWPKPHHFGSPLDLLPHKTPLLTRRTSQLSSHFLHWKHPAVSLPSHPPLMPPSRSTPPLVLWFADRTAKLLFIPLTLFRRNQTKEVEVNMVITDYCMPGMSGYDLLKRIKARKFQIRELELSLTQGRWRWGGFDPMSTTNAKPPCAVLWAPLISL